MTTPKFKIGDRVQVYCKNLFFGNIKAISLVGYEIYYYISEDGFYTPNLDGPFHSTQISMVQDVHSENWLKLGINKECECGKDKHNFAKHSDWCPKYE